MREEETRLNWAFERERSEFDRLNFLKERGDCGTGQGREGMEPLTLTFMECINVIIKWRVKQVMYKNQSGRF